MLAGTVVVPQRPAQADWAGPLSTSGRHIVDARGKRFMLKSGNWHGASGTWTGSGDVGDPATADHRRMRQLDRHLKEVLYRQAFYVADEADKHFTAPVWSSEFGVGGRDNNDPKSRAWFERFVDYLVETDADFAYWPLVGFHTNRGGNGWGLLHWDASGGRMGLYDGDDWRAGAWKRLVDAPAKPARAVQRWSMLSLGHADFQQSRAVRGLPDWDSGARRGVCPDGQRLIAQAHRQPRSLRRAGHCHGLPNCPRRVLRGH
ncbi:hypothetical protein [Kibdelosporangium phytohabitans]|uniref:Uncharacterized protein n=1 Tax=Kibdelosporangium phytohabitans TaxID=860235 RepID=A0A0N9IDF4_9PSEU|nr:hypothetical protein [Kibdelosporangium phytohabitans]ALG12722.1 hypothetical protein AOZ06_42955 [Kibdelosporangium phytohabitans]MBE1464391.1 hypothetical protein [Kibdelosporangium phytohabitans]